MSELLDHRIDMVLKCQKFLSFTSEQLIRLQHSIFFDPQKDIRRFVRLFRKAIERQVFSWNSMAIILRSAVEKWGAQIMKSTTKEFFNRDENRTLSCRLGNRLEARELGLPLSHGHAWMYFKWLKHMRDPVDHARAMVLLQRTQELSRSDWEV
jgi:hypothetical protein